MVDLSIVIVSWNVRDLLQRCLQSIDNSTARSPGLGVEVIVVDNGSGDGSAEMVRGRLTAAPGRFPETGGRSPQVRGRTLRLRLVANAENRGFPAANNQGIEVAGGRYVMLLNPDTEIVGDALAVLVAYADDHPGVGMVGPQLLNPDGSVQSSRRRFPTLTTALFESTWLETFAPRRVLERYAVRDRPDDVIQEVDWITGAAMVARREAVEEVGELDEGFFMYSEELDWCQRFRDAGWRIVYVPTAQVVHHVGKSSEQVVAARHVHFQTSKVRYFRKHHGALTGEVVRWWLLANYVWQLGLEGTKWLVGHKRPLRAERIRAYGQVLGSRLRPMRQRSGDARGCGD